MDELRKILRYDRLELVQQFKKASLTGQGTPEHVATDREGSLRNFLKKYFPYPHHVCKGKILDSYGNRSASIDAIVINPSHPRTMTQGQLPFFLAVEGVDYAIELKPSLNKTEELRRGLGQIRTVKKLRRRKARFLRRQNPSPEAALRVPCVLFSEKTFDDPRKLVETTVAYYMENAVPRDEQFDIICSLDGIVVINASEERFLNYSTNGIIFENFGEDVLYYFLYFLTLMPQATLRMQADVLSHYIRPPPNEWHTYPDLNALLHNL